MTLNRTLWTLGVFQKSALRALAIGLLAAASAAGCGAARPAQRSGDSAGSSASVAKSGSQTPSQSTPGEEGAPAQIGAQAVAGEKSAVSGGPPPQAQAAPAPAAAAPAPGDAGTDSGDKIPDGAIVGKIVSSFRGEDGTMTLYLNEGSAAKLRVNLSGCILEGSQGGKRLAGGEFTITKVISDHQSVAASKYGKSLGQNHRFMVVRPR